MKRLTACAIVSTCLLSGYAGASSLIQPISVKNRLNLTITDQRGHLVSNKVAYLAVTDRDIPLFMRRSGFRPWDIFAYKTDDGGHLSSRVSQNLAKTTDLVGVIALTAASLQGPPYHYLEFEIGPSSWIPFSPVFGALYEVSCPTTADESAGVRHDASECRRVKVYDGFDLIRYTGEQGDGPDGKMAFDVDAVVRLPDWALSGEPMIFTPLSRSPFPPYDDPYQEHQ